jgi:hypothetical protein
MVLRLLKQSDHAIHYGASDTVFSLETPANGLPGGRFDGHRVWVFHKAGGWSCREEGSIEFTVEAVKLVKDRGVWPPGGSHSAGLRCGMTIVSLSNVKMKIGHVLLITLRLRNLKTGPSGSSAGKPTKTPIRSLRIPNQATGVETARSKPLRLHRCHKRKYPLAAMV